MGKDADQVLNNYQIISAYPATGILYVVNGFLSGHVRLRGRAKGAYPFRYLEMLDNIFGFIMIQLKSVVALLLILVSIKLILILNANPI